MLAIRADGAQVGIVQFTVGFAHRRHVQVRTVYLDFFPRLFSSSSRVC